MFDQIKFFADTANISDIEYCFLKGVNKGITTNPKILEDTGDMSLGFEGACKSIVDKYPNVPISLETDLRGIDVQNLKTENTQKVKKILLKQAYILSNLGENVVVKIPVCEGGLLAAEQLAKEGIKTNITACMTPYQALKAADVGNGYVSLFANRILDTHILELAGYSPIVIKQDNKWKELVKENKEKYFDQAWRQTQAEIGYVAQELEKNSSVELIIGSIRSPEDIYKILEAQPQVITIPTKIVRGLEERCSDLSKLKKTKRSIGIKGILFGNSISHPMTDYTLIEFEKAADSYRV